MNITKFTVLGAVLLAQSIFAQFAQKPLPYAYDALETAIDAKTMEIHYTKHAAGYVNNLNKEIANTPLASQSLGNILAKVSKYSPAVRNNAGGHYNHEFFWTVLTPQKGTQPSVQLSKAIEKKFGSFDKFKEEFSKAGASRFGSGWAWLIVDKNGQLAVTSTPNQDNPLMDVAEVKGTPILGIDVWEHAYYLRYQNKRADYLTAFWDIVNWNEVSKRYDDALRNVVKKK